MKNGFFAIAGLLAVLAGGCTRVTMTQAQPACFTNVDRVQLMKACEKMLARMQFVIEKYDEESGLIRTRPLRGGQFFEFWRSDNASKFDRAESNIQSIRRMSELTFETRSSQVCVTCKVDTQRLSLPEIPIQGYYQAASLYTGGGRSEQRLEVKEKRQKEMQWIDLGRDEALEQKMLTKIQHIVKKGVK